MAVVAAKGDEPSAKSSGDCVDVMRFASTKESREGPPLVDDAVRETEMHYTTQGTAVRALDGQKSRLDALAETLANTHLRPIARVARAKLRGVPEFTELTQRVDVRKPTKLVAAAR